MLKKIANMMRIINQLLMLILRHIKDKQKLIKQRYKILLETKKTIKNNIELIYSVYKSYLKSHSQN